MKEDITLEKKSLAVMDEAKKLVIRSATQYEVGVAYISTIKRMQKEIKETFEPIIAKAYAAHKEAKAQQDKFLNPLVAAERELKDRTTAFYVEEQRKRDEQERKLQEKAEREEKEKKRKLEERAKKAEAEGKTEKAEELREKKEEVSVQAPIMPKVEKPKGVSYRTRYYGTVADKAQVPIQYLEVNLSAVNKVLSATPDIPIPGIRTNSEKIQSNR